MISKGMKRQKERKSYRSESDLTVDWLAGEKECAPRGI